MVRTYITNINRIMITILALLLMLQSPLTVEAAKETVAKGVSIQLDGVKVKLSSPLLKKDGKLFIPVALIAKSFHAKKISWNKSTEEATIVTSVNDKIVFGNGVPVVYFNEGRYLMNVKPLLKDGRFYIPLRHAAELMHAKVKWNEEKQIAALTTVKPAVAAQGYGLEEISKKYGISSAQLLARNGLTNASQVKAGTVLRVVMPSILANKAKAFTQEDLTLLAKITMVEAGYEPYAGQLGVANVILNRVKDSKFPDTVRGVIYSGNQFPPAHNGLLDNSVPKAGALRAAKDALNGKNNVSNAVYFFNPKVSKGSFWSSLKVIVTIGHHRFAR